jgi:hypothetical protein
LLRAAPAIPKRFLSPSVLVILALAGVTSIVSSMATGVLDATPTYAHGAPNGPMLEVKSLKVSPLVILSNRSVEVQAVIINLGNAPATDVKIALAAADPGPGRNWAPLSWHPSSVLSSLGPGEEEAFSGTARLQGNGWFRVGVAVFAQNALLEPRVQSVRVVEPIAAMAETLSVLLACMVVLGSLAFGAQTLLRGTSLYSLAPARAYLVAGLGLMSLAPVLWILRWIVIGRVGPAAPLWIWAWLPFLGAACFLAGWLTAGASLRPARSFTRGLVIAAELYAAVGLLWEIGYPLSLGVPVSRLATNAPSLLVAVPAWPVHVAQVFGLFGLTLT